MYIQGFPQGGVHGKRSQKRRSAFADPIFINLRPRERSKRQTGKSQAQQSTQTCAYTHTHTQTHTLGTDLVGASQEKQIVNQKLAKWAGNEQQGSRKQALP